MGEFALGVELREEHGKGVARKLRAAGRIPAVCYRRNAEPISVSLDPKRARRARATVEATTLAAATQRSN